MASMIKGSNMRKNKLDSIIKDIEYYFRFLFDKGYKVHHMKELPMGDWEVVFASLDNSIVIYSDHSEINLAFAPIDSDVKNQIGIRAMIYFSSHEQNFIGRYDKDILTNQKEMFVKLSSLLKEYMDQIIPYCGKDFEKYRYEIILARKKYNDIFIDRYIPKRKHQEW